MRQTPQTPREHAISIGGVDTAQLSSSDKPQDVPSDRQKDNVKGMSERERFAFDKMPPSTPYKPFR